MSVCCECCVLSRRDLCDELITRPEETYRLCCVVVSDLETSRTKRAWPPLGRSATKKFEWQEMVYYFIKIRLCSFVIFLSVFEHLTLVHIQDCLVLLKLN